MLRDVGPGEASISAEDGMVAIVFSTSIRALALSVDEAGSFAAAILEKADEAREQNTVAE
jgi:hypothetical protein